MKIFSMRAAAFVLSAAVAPAVYGQDSSDGAQEAPEELTVTAVSLPGLLQPYQVLSGEELLLKTAPTLGETLASEPGISSTYFGPAASRPIIRGLSGSRVTMLQDSASSLDVADVSPDHAVPIETLLADQVEIIRGPSSLLYGSTAAGGLVNVVDNRIPSAPAETPVSGAVEVRGDTAAEERTVVGRLDGGVGAFAWHLDGFTRKTEDIEIAGFATADPAERPADEKPGKLANSYSESDGVTGGLSWVDEQFYLGASLNYYKTNYGLPGPLEEPLDPSDPYAGPFIDLKQVRTDVRGEYRFQDAWIESTRLVLGVNDYEHQEIEPSGEVATTFNNDAVQLRLEALHRKTLGLKGVFGIQVDDRDFSAVGEEAFVAPTKTDAVGLFLMEEADFAWGQLQLGARYEDLEHKNQEFSDYSNGALSFSVGAAVNVGLSSQIIANLSSTQRNPNTEELYSNGEHIATRQEEIGLLVAGDTASTEDSINVELAWRRTDGDVTWDVSGFYYDFTDYVYQDIADGPDLPIATYTQANADFVGGEAAVSFPLFARTRFDNSLRLFADVVKAELANGDKLPRIPPWRTGVNFDFGMQSWTAGLDVIYHAKQDDISSFNTDAYTMVNANFLYRLDAGGLDWELFLRGSNLGDEEARKSTSFLAAYAPLPGRSWHAGARLKF